MLTRQAGDGTVLQRKQSDSSFGLGWEPQAHLRAVRHTQRHKVCWPWLLDLLLLVLSRLLISLLLAGLIGHGVLAAAGGAGVVLLL